MKVIIVLPNGREIEREAAKFYLTNAVFIKGVRFAINYIGMGAFHLYYAKSSDIPTEYIIRPSADSPLPPLILCDYKNKMSYRLNSKYFDDVED